MYGSEERNLENGSDVWLHKSKLITSSYCQGNRTASELTLPSFPVSYHSQNGYLFFSFFYLVWLVESYSHLNTVLRGQKKIFLSDFFRYFCTLTVFDFRESQDSNPGCSAPASTWQATILSNINSTTLQLISLQAFMCGSVSQNLFPISRTKARHRV